MAYLSEELYYVDGFSESLIICIKLNFMTIVYRHVSNDINNISRRQSVSFYAKSYCVIRYKAIDNLSWIEFDINNKRFATNIYRL